MCVCVCVCVCVYVLEFSRRLNSMKFSLAISNLTWLIAREDFIEQRIYVPLGVPLDSDPSESQNVPSQLRMWNLNKSFYKMTCPHFSHCSIR